MKKLLSLSLILLLSHCASAPKPPHCKDDGKGLKPVNTTPITLTAKEKND
ncbi:hypothetical protein L2734_09590 [Parashewanella spongiae]|nr:hypothetical protein [Parashewanella spongiae]MCL1078416.1 hypothetical protein [Parashewanella spongiae]